LLAIWDNIDSFDEDKNSFKNWVAAISKYKSIDYQRNKASSFLSLSSEIKLFS